MTDFQTHPKKLKDDLLNAINRREMALPDFQRDFVWQPGQTKSLIVSLAKRFPAGSLLLLESGEPIFQARSFTGAPDLNGHKPKYLVLDGQQRLSSLYHALYGNGEHIFYVSLKKLLDGAEIEDAIEFARKDQGHYYATLDKQARWGVLPLAVIFGGDGYHKWLRNVTKAIQELEAEGKQAGFTSAQIDDVDALYDTYIKPIETYEFPVVTLSEKTSLEAVCTIFETLNSTGVRLSVFDLLGARFFAQNENLRKRWADALDSTRHLKEFDIDPYYVLQAISAVSLNSIKRGDVLKLSPDIVSEWWDHVIWGMDETLDLLRTECGVLRKDLLSYNTIVVPMAAVFALHYNDTGPAQGALRTRLTRWYWCSVFGQRYESNPTSQTISDLNDIRRWMSGGQAPETIREFEFDKERLFTTTNRQRAIYRGVLCLILRNGPRDFHKAKVLTPGIMEEQLVDDHHVFPSAYLQSTMSLPSAEVDAIVNRTLIDRQTNQSIGKNPPSAYLEKVESSWNNPAMFDEVLGSHLLPTGPESSLRRDDYETFRHERAEALYRLIVKATS